MKKGVLTFDPEKHVYRLDGEKLPSVTGVLEPLNDFSGVPADVLKRAADFGTAVHLMAKLHFDDQLDEDDLDENLAGCHKALKKWEKDHNPLEQEYQEGIIIDIKSRELLIKKDSLQLSGYNLLWQGTGRPAGIFIEEPRGSAKHKLAGTPDILIASPGALTIKDRRILVLRRDGTYDYRSARHPQDDAMFKYMLENHHRNLAYAKKIKQWGEAR